MEWVLLLLLLLRVAKCQAEQCATLETSEKLIAKSARMTCFLPASFLFVAGSLSRDARHRRGAARLDRLPPTKCPVAVVWRFVIPYIFFKIHYILQVGCFEKKRDCWSCCCVTREGKKNQTCPHARRDDGDAKRQARTCFQNVSINQPLDYHGHLQY